MLMRQFRGRIRAGSCANTPKRAQGKGWRFNYRVNLWQACGPSALEVLDTRHGDLVQRRTVV